MGEEFKDPKPQLRLTSPETNSRLSSLVPGKIKSLFSKRPGTTRSEEHVPEENTGGSPIHPDIEEGMEHNLGPKLVEMVRAGNTAGIEICLINLRNAWGQAQKASGSRFELTPEAEQAFPDKVKETCAPHLSEGLKSIFERTVYGVRKGLEHHITDGPKSVGKLFMIADKFQIPINLVSSEEAEPEEGKLAVSVATLEQASGHMQKVIDNNLPQGVLGIIDILGFQVGQGLLSEMPGHLERIDRWLVIMENRGWSVVDEQTDSTYSGEAQPGLTPRQVNRAEIRQLIDLVVRNNLAKGARHISEMVRFKVGSGLFDPLETWGSPENIALYAEAGKKYGLTHSGGVATEEGGVEADMYFDPSELPQRIREAVQESIPDGLKAIVARHLQCVQAGDASQILFSEQTLNQYIELADESGVEVNSGPLNKAMAGHLTVANLEQGANALLAELKRAVRTANYISVSVSAREAEEFRRFINDKGFSDQVDSAKLDQYLEETATQAPRLAEAV